MNSSRELKLYIINQLKALPVCKASGNQKNWTVRCPYCGDSHNRSHGHFSIKIDIESDEVMLYRCFRCNESGILTNQTLEHLGIFINEGTSKDLRILNRKGKRSNKIDQPKRYKVYPLKRQGAEYDRKLDYINRRLGTSIDYEEASQYKIIFSFQEFIKDNYIERCAKDETTGLYLPNRSLEELENNYVGFLSSNNNKITCRDITPDGSGFFKRYYKLTLDILNQSPNSFYALKDIFDLLYTEPIDINISEGTFDILSVFKNLPRDHSENQLFFANCGYGFNSILKYVILNGVNTNSTVHIYSDADKTDRDHLYQLKKCSIPLNVWVDRFIVHRNQFQGEKDYGVPKDRIIDHSYELKI